MRSTWWRTRKRESVSYTHLLYHTDMWPETYLIDRNGIIRRKFVGPQDWTSPEIRNYLNSL